MDILTYILKWSEVILRWGHVLFAILWVGNSFLFNYLDNKLNKKNTSRGIDGEGYLILDEISDQSEVRLGDTAYWKFSDDKLIPYNSKAKINEGIVLKKVK